VDDPEVVAGAPSVRGSCRRLAVPTENPGGLLRRAAVYRKEAVLGEVLDTRGGAKGVLWDHRPNTLVLVARFHPACPSLPCIDHRTDTLVNQVARGCIQVLKGVVPFRPDVDISPHQVQAFSMPLPAEAAFPDIWAGCLVVAEGLVLAHLAFSPYLWEDLLSQRDGESGTFEGCRSVVHRVSSSTAHGATVRHFHHESHSVAAALADVRESEVVEMEGNRRTQSACAARREY